MADLYPRGLLGRVETYQVAVEADVENGPTVGFLFRGEPAELVVDRVTATYRLAGDGWVLAYLSAQGRRIKADGSLGVSRGCQWYEDGTRWHDPLSDAPAELQKWAVEHNPGGFGVAS
jgi:hypothetical protein